MTPHCVLPNTPLRLVTGAEGREEPVWAARGLGAGRGAVSRGSIGEMEGKAFGAHLVWLQGQSVT